MFPCWSPCRRRWQSQGSPSESTAGDPRPCRRGESRAGGGTAGSAVGGETSVPRPRRAAAERGADVHVSSFFWGHNHNSVTAALWKKMILSKHECKKHYFVCLRYIWGNISNNSIFLLAFRGSSNLWAAPGQAVTGAVLGSQWVVWELLPSSCSVGEDQAETLRVSHLPAPHSAPDHRAFFFLLLVLFRLQRK